MSTRLFKVGSFFAESAGSDMGQFIGANFGRGLTCRDQGNVLGVEANVVGYDTLHFRCGQVAAGNLNLALSGTPTANSMAFFGELNIPRPRTISVVHLHLIENAGAGSLAVEVYRRRSGVMTLLSTLTVVPADGDFATISDIPAGGLAELQARDYLYCQPIAKDLVAAGANGLTIDIHFAD